MRYLRLAYHAEGNLQSLLRLRHHFVNDAGGGLDAFYETSCLANDRCGNGCVAAFDGDLITLCLALARAAKVILAPAPLPYHIIFKNTSRIAPRPGPPADNIENALTDS